MSRKTIEIKTEKEQQDIYIKFKCEYNRICKLLNKDTIDVREWDSNDPFISAKILSRELKISFSNIAKKSGIEIPQNPKEKIDLDNKLILKLRLESCSLTEIANRMGVSFMTISRRLKEIYKNESEDTKNKLDAINEQLYCNKKQKL